MFFEHEDVVPVTATVAQQRIEAWLRGGGVSADGRQAYHAGETVLIRAGFGGITKRVAVETLPSTILDDVVVISVRWVATGPAGELFPALDGQIELEAAPPDSTRITFRGSYRPPLGSVGAALDRAVLGRAARATARSFAERMSRAALIRHEAADSEESLGVRWLAEGT